MVAARADAVAELATWFADAAAGLGLEGEPRSRYAPAQRRRRRRGARLRAARAPRGRRPARPHQPTGPHLDEIEISFGGRSLRRYGSQGQQRSALLALLFAEREALLEIAAAPPLMLLDDVMSELDGERRELLDDPLAAGGQALITATGAGARPGLVRALRGQCPRRRRRPPGAGGMNRRRTPRSAAFALHDVIDKRAPRTLLAAVQSEWERVCGAAIAAESQPVAEREGVVTVACRSATWAQELDLMQGEPPRAPQRDACGAARRGSALHRRRGPPRALKRGSEQPPPNTPPRLSPGAAFVRDLQVFCGNPCRISVGRGCYPYENLDGRPDRPEKGLAEGRFHPLGSGLFTSGSRATERN